MSLVKIQSGQTDEIQCSPLSMLSLEMHLPQAPQFSTPVLRPWLWDISWYIDCEKASFWAKTDGVVLWQIKWDPKGMKSKLPPSFTLSNPLESRRPTLPSAQLSPAWITGSDKVSQDFSVGIFQRTSETHLLRGRASTTQQGHDWLDLDMTNLWSWCVCHLLSWNEIIT